MAKHLMIWTLLACLVRMPLAMAEVLRDPTMPAAQSGLIPASQLPEVAPPPMLQSITLGTTAKYAMINGKTVMLGQAYEQWVLVKLTASEAVLRAKDGSTNVLVMAYPIKKTGQTSPSPAKGVPSLGQSSIPKSSNNHLTESPSVQAHIQAESLQVKK